MMLLRASLRAAAYDMPRSPLRFFMPFVSIIIVDADADTGAMLFSFALFRHITLLLPRR